MKGKRDTLQAFLADIPYHPILHDLSNTSRIMSAAEIVDYWLNMFETTDVTEWFEAFKIIDMPRLQKTFSGIFGHILLLEFGFNRTVEIATPFMNLLGVKDEDQRFIFDEYLPLLEQYIGHIDLTLLETAELNENAIGTVVKLLWAFVWQESIIDLGCIKSAITFSFVSTCIFLQGSMKCQRVMCGEHLCNLK